MKYKKNLIVGIGNPILKDDAIGLLILKDLKNYLAEIKNKDTAVLENYSVGIDLLEDLSGYKKLIIIDSFISDSHEPGTCLFFNIGNDDCHYYNPVSSHGLDLNTLWKLGNMLELSMPDDCLIIGIVIYDSINFSEKLSGRLSASYKNILNTVKNKVEQWF